MTQPTVNLHYPTREEWVELFGSFDTAATMVKSYNDTMALEGHTDPPPFTITDALLCLLLFELRKRQ